MLVCLFSSQLLHGVQIRRGSVEGRTSFHVGSQHRRHLECVVYTLSTQLALSSHSASVADGQMLLIVCVSGWSRCRCPRRVSAFCHQGHLISAGAGKKSDMRGGGVGNVDSHKRDGLLECQVTCRSSQGCFASAAVITTVSRA